jgi:hypothetical protein
MQFPSIMSHDGRRAWAFAALICACGIFTAFASIGVYLVSENLKYSFYLALAAHAQLFVALGGIVALLVRRSVKITRSGAEFADQEVRGESEQITKS